MLPSLLSAHAGLIGTETRCLFMLLFIGWLVWMFLQGFTQPWPTHTAGRFPSLSFCFTFLLLIQLSCALAQTHTRDSDSSRMSDTCKCLPRLEWPVCDLHSTTSCPEHTASLEQVCVWISLHLYKSIWKDDIIPMWHGKGKGSWQTGWCSDAGVHWLVWVSKKAESNQIA